MYKSSYSRSSFKNKNQSIQFDTSNYCIRRKNLRTLNTKHPKTIPGTDQYGEYRKSVVEELCTTSSDRRNLNHKLSASDHISLPPSRFHHNNVGVRPYQRTAIKDKLRHESTLGSDHLRMQDRDSFRIPGYGSSNLVMERRGGLTWIKNPNGVLVPYIENTWLKHMITTLLPDTEALMKFLKTLQTCLEEALLFLYNEGIKPYLGDVANQMKRSIVDNFWSASEVAFVSLHCREMVDLKIELRVKGEMGWVVYMREEPPGFLGFVDTHSTVDCYSKYHWRALNQFAVDIMTYDNAPNKKGNQGEENSLAFTGGRYAFAERLRKTVRAFNSMRLGEVVHLVQLAIYSGVFVYAQRILLPVTACEKTAEEMFPCLKKINHPACSSLDEVNHIISVLVDNRKKGLVLAQLKQQFMMQFNKELNPLAFGFRKLQNLLLSDNFSDRYQLFVPVDSPHRTHIQHRKYAIPPGCRTFQQSKVRFDPDKFWSPLYEWYDEPSSNMVLNDLPSNIRSAVAEILDTDDQEEAEWRQTCDSPRDSSLLSDYISTEDAASNCITARDTSYQNVVKRTDDLPTRRLNKDTVRSASV